MDTAVRGHTPVTQNWGSNPIFNHLSGLHSGPVVSQHKYPSYHQSQDSRGGSSHPAVVSPAHPEPIAGALPDEVSSWSCLPRNGTTPLIIEVHGMELFYDFPSS